MAFIAALILLVSISSISTSDEGFPFGKDYFDMDGTLIKHPFSSSVDSLSSKELWELQDENGLSIWFGRFIYKDICVSGICRMVKLWIFWDGAGNYLGYQLNNNEPLTKRDHVAFDPLDYYRLHEILSDTSSILKDLRYEDLTDTTKETKPSVLDVDVDGYTSATNPSLSEYVIKDAVFTCYTLWHTVYGETFTHIKEILNDRITSDYIEKLFEANNLYQAFALDKIKENFAYFDDFEPQILELISSADKNISQKAMSLITKEYLSNPKNQLKFIDLIDTSQPTTKYEIIYKLQSLGGVYDESILLLLDKYAKGNISVGGLNHVYQLISVEALENEKIQAKLIELSHSSDPYVANLTNSVLNKRNNP
ncbi:MAG: hypothetical protein ABFC39_10830 [Proteiniphilum sp.]